MNRSGRLGVVSRWGWERGGMLSTLLTNATLSGTLRHNEPSYERPVKKSFQNSNQ